LFIAAVIGMVELHLRSEGFLDFCACAISSDFEDEIRIHVALRKLPRDRTPRLATASEVGTGTFGMGCLAVTLACGRGTPERWFVDQPVAARAIATFQQISEFTRLNYSISNRFPQVEERWGQPAAA
jgi:hypothetical protein